MFVASGLPESRFLPYTRNLEQKDFEVVGTSSCRGFDTRLPFKLVGDINKGRRDATDLEAARTFAKGLRARSNPMPTA
ncbi:NADPH-dependent FMN reductase family protein [Rhodococcus opacus]|uniref:hypothetical protein n=1 Tax=Rhodococcus opacus TaxID=37919 RepID=UPI001AB05F97|nr:hypothetical protein [Rhodococcus opacus]MDV6247689.1 hypothetical protein [Rhodococcus opacus]UZG55427.1 hypothetical protein ONE62_36360 [Rhodococcus opacus]